MMEILFFLNNRCFFWSAEGSIKQGEVLEETIRHGDSKWGIVARETSVLPEWHGLNALLICNHGGYSASEWNFLMV